jgi:hypothetical protein
VLAYLQLPRFLNGKIGAATASGGVASDDRLPCATSP